MTRTALLAAVLLAAAPSLATAADNDLHILPKPEKPRFTVTDRDWPKDPGQASVCLWKADRLAAASITIDDNNAQDHPFWIETAKKYGFHFTWFVISGRVGQDDFGGKWDNFIKLHDLGHDIESHTVDHFASHGTPPNAILPVEQDYAQAIKDIEAHVPGTKVVTLAYPGGAKPDPNDPALAAKYYIASRGTVGTFNIVNKINYMNTNSVGGPALLKTDYWAGLPNTITLNPAHKDDFRAWACMHFHTIGNNQALRKSITETFDFLHNHDADFWVAPFTDVVKYGQERDTASLQSSPAAPAQLQFTLTDRMNDTLFDAPLTVKVHLNPDWKSITATQADKPIPATLISHDGAPYALVEATPDRGPVTLKPK